jgi:peptidoglycan hydrolase-like protein with peptidoglycan-binding domain
MRIPSGRSGVRSAAGNLLARPVHTTFYTRDWSVLRLDQVLAQLGYLPLSWHPRGLSEVPPAASLAAQLAAAYDPPHGSFGWQASYPASLTGLWTAGQVDLILTGAVMAFEADNGLQPDGVAGPGVWMTLLEALANGRGNTHGYTYAVASKAIPETLTLWHNGAVMLHTLANTGIAASPTVDGTFPVYLRLQYQVMSGFNPNGSHYSDPVWWVAYFNGSDAVHYYLRAVYGLPQSLGCVELPWTQAKEAWPYLTYGSLVTVQG